MAAADCPGRSYLSDAPENPHLRRAATDVLRQPTVSSLLKKLTFSRLILAAKPWWAGTDDALTRNSRKLSPFKTRE